MRTDSTRPKETGPTPVARAARPAEPRVISAFLCGDWRVVYIVDDVAKLISVTRIAHRREVYER